MAASMAACNAAREPKQLSRCPLISKSNALGISMLTNRGELLCTQAQTLAALIAARSGKPLRLHQIRKHDGIPKLFRARTGRRPARAAARRRRIAGPCFGYDRRQGLGEAAIGWSHPQTSPAVADFPAA